MQKSSLFLKQKLIEFRSKFRFFSSKMIQKGFTTFNNLVQFANNYLQQMIKTILRNLKLSLSKILSLLSYQITSFWKLSFYVHKISAKLKLSTLALTFKSALRNRASSYKIRWWFFQVTNETEHWTAANVLCCSFLQNENGILSVYAFVWKNFFFHRSKKEDFCNNTNTIKAMTHVVEKS